MELIAAVVLLYIALRACGHIALVVTSVVGVVRTRRDLEGSSPEAIAARGRAAIPVSILCPVCNEEQTVVESVRSLLQVRYPQHEVIVVNDSSTDRTMQVLRQAFALEAVPFDIRMDLPCMPVRAVYRSGLFKKLIVLDKAFGGKSDSLNCAVNASRFPLIMALDSTKLILPDVLLRLARPFLADIGVVGVGGVVIPANGCAVERGEVVAMGMPKSWIARLQIVGQLRDAMEAMGWSELNGAVTVSGDFCMLQRTAVVGAGGYRNAAGSKDVGELMFRLRHQMPTWAQGTALVHLPDPIALAEVPESFRALSRQRMNWHRDTLRNLWLHRQMLFNRRYGLVGLMWMPILLLTEAFGPILELLAYVYVGVGYFGGAIRSGPSLALVLGLVLPGLILSLGAITLEEMTLSFYRSRYDMARLVFAAIFEELGYHQVAVLFKLRAIWEFFLGVWRREFVIAPVHSAKEVAKERSPSPDSRNHPATGAQVPETRSPPQDNAAESDDRHATTFSETLERLFADALAPVQKQLAQLSERIREIDEELEPVRKQNRETDMRSDTLLRQLQMCVDDMPNSRISVPADAQAAQKSLALRGIFVESNVIEGCLAAIRMAKPLMLVGPPGAGKTELARALHTLVSTDTGGTDFDLVECHAFASLSHQEIIGHRSIVGTQVTFVPGDFTNAVIGCCVTGHPHWLFIDDIQEADPRLVFGGLFDTLSRMPRGSATFTVPGFPSKVPVPPSFRLIVAMNEGPDVFGAPLSNALAQRFCRVNVDSPSLNCLEKIFEWQLADLCHELALAVTPNYSATFNIVRQVHGMQSEGDATRQLISGRAVANFAQAIPASSNQDFEVRVDVAAAQYLLPGELALELPVLSRLANDVFPDAKYPRCHGILQSRIEAQEAELNLG